MRIGKLTSTGVKNLDLKDVPFGPTTLIHGPNGIGKSNLLLLIGVLLQRKEQTPEIRDAIRFPIEGVVRVSDFLQRNQKQGKVSLTLECYTKSYKELLKSFPNPKKSAGVKVPHQVTLEFLISDYSGGIRVDLQSIQIGAREIYSPSATLSADQLKALDDWLAVEVVDSVVYIPANRIHRRDLVPLELVETEPVVDHLENTVLRLLTSRDGGGESIERIKSTMKDFFRSQDIRSEIQSIPAAGGNGPPRLLVGVRIREDSGEWFDLERVGTGVQQLLAIISTIHVSRAKIALIEEFDTSLSPQKRSNLVEQLKQLVGDDKPLRQVICTSHTTYEPRQQRVISLGAERNPNGRTGFRPWTKSDWARFQRSD